MRTTDPRHHPKKWKTQSQQARKLTGHRCCLCWRKATETHHAFYGMRLLGATLHIPGRELPGWQLFPLCDRHHSNRPGAVHHFHHYRVNKSDHWGNHNTTAYLWRLRIGFLLAVAIAHLPSHPNSLGNPMAIRADLLCFGILGAVFLTSIPTMAERHPAGDPQTQKLIAGSEGFNPCPYRDPVGVPTIGYGATSYPTGKRVTLNDACLSKAEAKSLLDWHIQQARGAVDRLVKVPITDGQKTALTSFAYNLGSGALESSTLLKKLNSGDQEGAATEFDRWTKGGGKELPGLVDRRTREKQLFKR